MLNSYENLIKEFKNKSVMIYGIGKSNLPLVEMLIEEKVPITVYDNRNEEKIQASALKLLRSSKYVDLRICDEKIWDEFFDIIIKSPGISFLSDKIKRAHLKGSVITSEMEIFFDLCPCPIVGVTGSDGKTTTTTIIYEILKKTGKKVHLGGNIGKPLLPNIKNISKDDIAVVELSSFQLMSMRKSPDIAVVNNISPNHLDYHSDMNEYIEAKKQILLHQGAFSKTVLNFDNEETKRMQKDVRGKAIFFSRKFKPPFGVWIDKENNIIIFDGKKEEIILNRADIKLPGDHNLENYLAAIGCVYEIASKENIKEVARSFEGVSHRIEFVKNVNGVSYYNDSIASTPTRSINGALSLFDKKIILIAGGYDKKVPFDSFAEKIIEKVSALILIGNSAQKIHSEVLKCKSYNPEQIKILIAKSMEEAVCFAHENSSSGDIVVLSPACASFDLYKDFEERGNHFKSIVEKLPEK